VTDLDSDNIVGDASCSESADTVSSQLVSPVQVRHRHVMSYDYGS